MAVSTGSWLASWWGGEAGLKPEGSDAGTDGTLTVAERALLYQDLAASEVAYDVDDVLQQISLAVGHPDSDRWCSVTLSVDGTELLKAKTSGTYEMLRRIDSWRFAVSVATFEVVDCTARAGPGRSASQHPKLICLLDEAHRSVARLPSSPSRRAEG